LCLRSNTVPPNISQTTLAHWKCEFRGGHWVKRKNVGRDGSDMGCGGGDGDGNPLKSVWEVQGEANLIYQTENRFYAKRKSKEDKERYANKSEC